MASGFLHPPPPPPLPGPRYCTVWLLSIPPPCHLAIDWSGRHYVREIIALRSIVILKWKNQWLRTDEMSRVLTATEATAAVFQLMTGKRGTAQNLTAQRGIATQPFPRVEPGHGKDGALSFLRFLKDPHRGSEKSH